MKIDLLYIDTLFLAEFSYLISKSTSNKVYISSRNLPNSQFWLFVTWSFWPYDWVQYVEFYGTVNSIFHCSAQSLFIIFSFSQQPAKSYSKKLIEILQSVPNEHIKLFILYYDIFL